MRVELKTEQKLALEGRALPIRLSELPTPPEITEEARRQTPGLFGWLGNCRARLVEKLKLRHYFPGRYLRTLRIRGDLLVVAIHSGDQAEYERQLATLSADQKRSTGVHVIPGADEGETAYLGDVFADEGTDPTTGV